MASKWREFWIFSESSELKTVEQQGQCGEMYVIEKAALDDALELIGELEKFIEPQAKSMAETRYESGVHLGGVSLAEQALAKIKAFKDRGSE